MARFELLPYEIQIQIWTESIEPRIVPIKRDSEYGQNDGTQGWKIFAPQPVLFSICSETRKLALSLSQDLAQLDIHSHDDGDAEEPYHYNWRKENVLWDFYWDKPGMMRLAVDILCKHGGITNLALDFRNFHPALRDILRLEMDKDQTGLSFIQDEEYAEMIDEQMEIAALMSKFPLKTITYIHNGDKDVLQRQTRQKSTLKEHLGQVEVMSTGTLLPGSIEEDNPGLPWLGWLNAVQASKVNLYLQMCQQKNIARSGGGGNEGGGEVGEYRRLGLDRDIMPTLLFKEYLAT
ncbi:hypothetical protein BKA64DRAFT_760094 [Cadophora sp. MPI-SDFR-AT-0126]|nr:hypothetical protein BKA64DRAFT_760094 [Leotiomycetes sp. MPI-SDFR-AT-0126]